MFVTVGRDANNQMYPIAWSVAQSETREVWEWFISLMQANLEMGDGTGWTLISYQQKVSCCILFFHPTALLYSSAFCYFISVPYLLFDFYCICGGTY